MAKNETGLFTANMKYLREDCKRFKQEQFLGIRQSRISEIENKTGRIFLDEAIEICDVVNESLDDMVRLDMRQIDEKWLEEGQKRIAVWGRTGSIDDELIGRRPLVNNRILERFQNKSFYIYYVSGVSKSDTKTGKLVLKPRRPNANFILGVLRTNSQEYTCKLIVEHPLHVYVFGNSVDNVERLTIVFKEPKVRYDDKSYYGGLALALRLGSRGLPTVQRFAISEFPLILNDDLNRFLHLGSSNGYWCEISEKDEEEFYEYLSKFRGVMK